jgi:hypothetical protein
MAVCCFCCAPAGSVLPLLRAVVHLLVMCCHCCARSCTCWQCVATAARGCAPAGQQTVFPPSTRTQVLKATFHTKIGLLLMAVSHFSPTTAATEAFICLSSAVANDDNISAILGYTNSIMDNTEHTIVTTCCNKVVACAHAVLVSCSVASCVRWLLVPLVIRLWHWSKQPLSHGISS